VEIDAEVVLKKARQHEARHRDPDQNQNHRQIVERRSALEGGNDAETDAKDDGQDHGADAEIQ
jgi:hypothetical protein